MTSRGNHIKLAGLWLMGLLMALPSLFAEVGELELGGAKQTYDRIPGTFITRHVEWAKPLPGGPVKAFIVCTQSAAREVVELAERLALDYTVVMTGDRNYLTQAPSFNPGAANWGGLLVNGERVIPRLFKERLDPSRQYDLIIIAKVHWDVLPDFARENIIERVKKGAGLVMVSEVPHTYQKGVPEGTPGAIVENPYSQNKTYYINAERSMPSLAELKEDPGEIFRNAIPLDQIPLLPATNQVQAQAVVKEYDQKHPEPGLYDEKERTAFDLKSGTLGAGRVVALTYFNEPRYELQHAFTPAIVYSFKRYDLFQAIFSKICLYAAGKEGATRLKVDAQNPKQIALADLGKTSLRLQVEGKPGEAGEFCWNYRDKDGEAIGQGSTTDTKLSNGALTIPIPKELNRPGIYTLDAWAKDNKGNVLDFASFGFEVPKPDGIKIVSIGTEKDRYKEGETVKGKILLDGDIPKDGKARLIVKDTWKRVVYTTNLSVTGKEVEFAFPVHAPLSTYWEVTAVIENSSFELASKSCAIAIPNSKLNNFYLVQGGYYWGGIQRGLEACPELKERQLRAGVEAAMVVYPQWADLAARDGWRISGIITHQFASSVWQNKDAEGNLINQNCLNNPEVGKEDESKTWEKACTERVKAYAKYGNIGAALGFESFIPKACLCKWCREKFRAYVKNVYKTIDRLNAEWGSDYKSFDEVVPLPPVEAFKLNRPSQWVDHQLWHTCEVNSGFYIKVIKHLRQFDPELRPFIIDSAYYDYGLIGHDWPRFSKEITGGMYDDYSCSFLGPYGGIALMVRSLGNDQGYFGMFGDTNYDGNKADWAHRIMPWWLLFRGFSGVWSGFGFSSGQGWAGAASGQTTADGSEPMPWFKGFLETTAEVRKGPATLMLESKFSREPIAIVLSTVNSLASMMDPLGDTSDIEAIKDHMQVLKVMGVEPHFIGDQDINEKTLTERGFKAVLLPYNKALSDDQAGVLREFVKKGGLLIADNNPGSMDEHCKVRPTPVLKDLFPVTDKLNLTKYENGHALYLAGEFRGANLKVPQGERKGIKEFQETLAKAANIRPPVELLNDKGIERYDSESGSYVNNGARYLCLLRDHYAKEISSDETTLRLAETSHIYDIRAKKYLGQAGEFKLNLPKDEPKFIGLVPAKFLDMKVELASRKIKPGEDIAFAVEFKFDKDIPFGHGVHVEVLDPKGKSLLYYFKNYVFTGKEFKATLPTAYDMAPGKYILKVNSIVSGLEKEVVFDVGQNKTWYERIIIKKEAANASN